LNKNLSQKFKFKNLIGLTENGKNMKKTRQF
jgi:hypothetical protein